MNLSDFDNRDTIMQVSHYLWAKRVLGIIKIEDMAIEKNLIDECRLDTIFGQRKNPSYRWSNSDGLTKWLYDNVLRFIGLDPFKGSNHDQLRAWFLYSYTKDRQLDSTILGFIFRLGFAPSLMEHALLKLQAHVLLLRNTKNRFFNPLYWASRLAFYISMKKNLKEPIKGHTTNKITLLPTMYYLGYKLPPRAYIEGVYNRYYGKDSELGTLMILALCKLKVVGDE